MSKAKNKWVEMYGTHGAASAPCPCDNIDHMAIEHFIGDLTIIDEAAAVRLSELLDPILGGTE